MAGLVGFLTKNSQGKTTKDYQGKTTKDYQGKTTKDYQGKTTKNTKYMETTRKEDFERIRELIDFYKKGSFSGENELELLALIKMIAGSDYSQCNFFRTYKLKDKTCIDILIAWAMVELSVYLLNKVVNNLGNLKDIQKSLIVTLEKQLDDLDKLETGLQEIITDAS